MKRINLLSALLIVFSTFYSLAYSKNVLNTPEFKWSVLSHDFGKIKKGVPVTFIFKFTNVGKTPLIISDSKAGCGCTTTNFSKEPIAPGKSGFVQVTYNAAAKGTFSKIVSVTSNASEIAEELAISGEVME